MSLNITLSPENVASFVIDDNCNHAGMPTHACEIILTDGQVRRVTLNHEQIVPLVHSIALDKIVCCFRPEHFGDFSDYSSEDLLKKIFKS